MAIKSSSIPVIQRSRIKINSVVPYDTFKSKSDKFEFSSMIDFPHTHYY